MSISRFSSLLAFTLLTVAACGSEGPMGEMGDPGAKGDKGDMGTPGQNGQDGDDGADGAAGTPGTNGTNGSNGSAGLSCWDLNGNATCDVAQEDKTADNMCTVADCQGAVGPQGPAGPAGATAGQTVATALGSGVLTLAPNNAAAVPGLGGTLTVPATGQYMAFVSTHGSAAIADADPDTFAAVTMFVRIDNAAPATGGGFQNMAMFNGALGGEGVDHWSFSFATGILPAGTHTFTVNAANSQGSDSSVQISGDAVNNAGFQGGLTVLLLKL